MSVFFPEASPVLGNLSVKWIASASNLSAISLATEYNAATSLDLTCFLRPFAPGQTENTGSAPDRICTTITLPQRGRTQISAFELRYVYDPQLTGTTGAADDNDALDKLIAGATGILVLRKGIAFSTAAATTQKYEAWRGYLGRQNRVTSGDDDFAEFEVSQMFFPTADVVNGALVA